MCNHSVHEPLVGQEVLDVLLAKLRYHQHVVVVRYVICSVVSGIVIVDVVCGVVH